MNRPLLSGKRGPLPGTGGRPKGPPKERLNWRLPLGTVKGLKRNATALGLTGPAYLAKLANNTLP